MGLPPSKLGADHGNTYGNREADELNFLQDSIQPWLIQIEQEVNRKLFFESEQGSYFAEFLLDGRLRADAGARAAYYTSLTNIGAITPNEVRDRENMNPYAGGVGDAPVVGSNYQPLAGVGVQEPPAEDTEPGELLGDVQEPDPNDVLDGTPADDDGDVPAPAAADAPDAPPLVGLAPPTPGADLPARARMQARFAPLLRDLLTRATPDTLADAAEPVLRAYAGAVADQCADELGDDCECEDDGDCERCEPDDQFLTAYRAYMAKRHRDWSGDVDALTEREASRARHAFSRHAFERLGVTKLRWQGGELDGQECAAAGQFTRADGKRLGHPDADNAGELVGIK